MFKIGPAENPPQERRVEAKNLWLCQIQISVSDIRDASRPCALVMRLAAARVDHGVWTVPSVRSQPPGRRHGSASGAGGGSVARYTYDSGSDISH